MKKKNIKVRSNSEKIKKTVNNPQTLINTYYSPTSKERFFVYLKGNSKKESEINDKGILVCFILKVIN